MIDIDNLCAKDTGRKVLFIGAGGAEECKIGDMGNLLGLAKEKRLVAVVKEGLDDSVFLIGATHLSWPN